MKYVVFLLSALLPAMVLAEIKTPSPEKPVTGEIVSADKEKPVEDNEKEKQATSTPQPAQRMAPAGPLYTVDLEKKTLIKLPEPETNLPPEISRPETYELPAMMPPTTWNRNLMPPLVKPEDIPSWHDRIRVGDVPSSMKYTGEKP